MLPGSPQVVPLTSMPPIIRFLSPTYPFPVYPNCFAWGSVRRKTHQGGKARGAGILVCVFVCVFVAAASAESVRRMGETTDSTTMGGGGGATDGKAKARKVARTQHARISKQHRELLVDRPQRENLLKQQHQHQRQQQQQQQQQEQKSTRS